MVKEANTTVIIKDNNNNNKILTASFSREGIKKDEIYEGKKWTRDERTEMKGKLKEKGE